MINFYGGRHTENLMNFCRFKIKLKTQEKKKSKTREENKRGAQSLEYGENNMEQKTKR